MVDNNEFRTKLHEQLDELINQMELDNVIETPVQLSIYNAVTDEDAYLVSDANYIAYFVGHTDGSMSLDERFKILRDFEDNEEINKERIEF